MYGATGLPRPESVAMLQLLLTAERFRLWGFGLRVLDLGLGYGVWGALGLWGLGIGFKRVWFGA